MTARDDATRAAVAPLLTDLRADLLVMPQEQIVEQHLEMMAFEQRVLTTPRFVPTRNRRRMPAPRRALIAFVCAISTIVSCGLSAAGALPAPLQHITETIARTFGVPHATDTPTAPKPKAAGAPDATRPVTHDSAPATANPAPSKAAPTAHKAKAAATKPSVSVPAPTTTTSPDLPSQETPAAPARPHLPPQRISPVDPGKRPSTNSSNDPAGFPSDWRRQAAVEAAVQFAWTCSQAKTLTPTTCPQQAAVTGPAPNDQTVQWSILNDPFGGAAVVATTKPGNPAMHVHPTTVITVYIAFQMEATYTAVDGSGPYRAYSAGIGAATMTWDGTDFVNVSFTPGSVAGRLLPGVKPPSIPRPGSVTDAAVLGAVQTGFTACTAPTAAGYVLSCPQTTAAGEQWTVSGDPAQGATVAYDPTYGLYTVTGSYAMTSNLGNAASGPYTAKLYFDGTQLQVLNITSS